MSRYRYLLSTIKKDKKDRYHALDVMRLLRDECELSDQLLSEIRRLKEVIERANAIIIAQRENRKQPKCKPKPISMRAPAVIKRSVRAALAR